MEMCTLCHNPGFYAFLELNNHLNSLLSFTHDMHVCKKIDTQYTVSSSNRQIRISAKFVYNLEKFQGIGEVLRVFEKFRGILRNFK